MISVVIPTRNRPILLTSLLRKLQLQTKKIGQIIVVDSSDDNLDIEPDTLSIPNLEYTKVLVRSAAVQRNIGLQLVEPTTEYLVYLDDDVVPPDTYIEALISSLEHFGAIGISGLAINPNTSLRGKGFFHKVFLLDSTKDGKLIGSGINVPVRIYEGDPIKTDWLIGCSVWKFQVVKDLRFESDFHGQSLCEDVIYSQYARKRGNLYIDPNVHLKHYESQIERPQAREFWKMWVVNRRRLIKVINNGYFGIVQYWWANLGQLVICTYSGLTNRNYGFQASLGILQGSILVLRGAKG